MQAATDIPAPSEIAADSDHKLLARLEHEYPSQVDRSYELELRSIWKTSPLQQIIKRPRQFDPYSKIYYLRSAAPPGAWQIDLVDFTSLLTESSKKYALMLIEIPSRFLWACPVKANSQAVPLRRTMRAYRKFAENEIETLTSVYGDDYFNNIAFRAYNDVLHVNVFTHVADDDHVTKGDFLGILDIAIRNFRELLSKAQALALTSSNDWHQLLQKVIKVYNTNPHPALNGQTPQDVHANYELAYSIYKRDLAYNKTLKAKHAQFFRYKPDDRVRILKKYWKDADKKRRLVRFPIEIYKVVRQDGNK